MKIARHGDTTSHGGIVLAITTHTYVNGQLVITPGAGHACPEHGMNVVVSGSSNVYVENMPVSRIGDVCSCGAVIVSASPNTHANG